MRTFSLSILRDGIAGQQHTNDNTSAVLSNVNDRPRELAEYRYRDNNSFARAVKSDRDSTRL